MGYLKPGDGGKPSRDLIDDIAAALTEERKRIAEMEQELVDIKKHYEKRILTLQNIIRDDAKTNREYIAALESLVRDFLKYAKETLAHGGSWCKQVADAEALLAGPSEAPRCKHDVHGKDCFECYPVAPKVNRDECAKCGCLRTTHPVRWPSGECLEFVPPDEGRVRE